MVGDRAGSVSTVCGGNEEEEAKDRRGAAVFGDQVRAKAPEAERDQV
jgi:hypothetical protein